MDKLWWIEERSDDLFTFGMVDITGTSWAYMNTRFYKFYGPGGVIFSFMIGALMTALIALSYAELEAAIKREEEKLHLHIPYSNLYSIAEHQFIFHRYF